MLDREMWSEFEPEMSAYGPTHFVDLDCGASIAEMADLAIEELPDRFILIGFSLGGYVAREIVRRVPDKISALVLVATSARGDTLQQTRRRELALQTVSPVFKGLSPSAIARSVHVDRRSDKALIKKLRDLGMRLGVDTFRRQSALARTGDSDRLSEINCPTLVIAAHDDELRSIAEASELVTSIPSAVMKTIVNSGHMVPLEQPALLANVIKEWLQNLHISC
jgi:pimeloyl-ACP methyl ester carboxylesterase